MKRLVFYAFLLFVTWWVLTVLRTFVGLLQHPPVG